MAKYAFDEKLLSRDYDVKDIVEDSRLARCFKEFLMVFAVCTVGVVLISILCWGIDYGPVTGYSYILGLPAWIGIAAIATAIFTVAAVILANKMIQDTDLEDTDENVITNK